MRHLFIVAQSALCLFSFCMSQATVSAAVLKYPDQAQFLPEEHHPESGVCDHAGCRELQLRGQERKRDQCKDRLGRNLW